MRTMYPDDGTKTCEACGKEFERPRTCSLGNWKRARFCSIPCRHTCLSKKVATEMELFALCHPEPNSGCWIWAGDCHRRHGYGRVSQNNRPVQVHRLAYALRHGTIPDDLSVLHHCDTRLCANPDHLYIGTAADNMRDCITRKRIPRGERRASAKLTEADVRTILSSGGTGRALAEALGVSQGTIGKIRRRERWRHVSP